MSGREAFERKAALYGWDLRSQYDAETDSYADTELQRLYTGFKWGDQARDAELAAKDARIAKLEAALKAIKALQRWDSPEYGPEPYRDDQGAFVIFDDVDDIIEEALR